MRSPRGLRLPALALLVVAFAVAACQQNENRSITVEQSAAKRTAESQKNTLTAEDKDFLIRAANQNIKVKTAAQIAESRSQSSEVKEYAKVVGRDFDKAETKLVDLMKKYGEPRTENMSDQAGTEIEMLRSVPDESFDDAFISTLIQVQQSILTEFQQAASIASNPDVRDYAASELPVIQQDLARAQRVRAELQT